MEYEPFSTYISGYLPPKLAQNVFFISYLQGTLVKQPGPFSSTMYQYADALFYTLPSPRYQYYEYSTYTSI
jgi:hypothetical protein